MNITTPIKPTELSKIQNISPIKKPSNLSNTKLNSSIHTIKQHESATHSLVQKIIQNSIMNEQQYQNLLINNKQLEIKILNLEQEAAKLKKQYRKSSKPIQQLKNSLQRAQVSLSQKQQYLEKFYVHLDGKLKGNVNSNLFNKLQKIQIALMHKYEQQRSELLSTLTEPQQKAQLANEQLLRLRQYRDELIRQYTQRAIQQSQKQLSQKKQASSSNRYRNKSSLHSHSHSSKSNNKSPAQKRKQEKLKLKQTNVGECQFLKENIKKLKKQKQTLEKDQKMLKILLNIDQEHKKYSQYIINGYKKVFSIKYRQAFLKRKSIPLPLRTPQPDLESLIREINQKVSQKKVLQQQIALRSNSLQMTKLKLNEEIGEYSELEQHIMTSVSNRNSYANPRSTYTAKSKPEAEIEYDQQE